MKLIAAVIIFSISVSLQAAVLKSPDTTSGYIARLLLNEAPFPGERGWVSEADTKAAMLQILWVLESRRTHIPPGYRQRQLAATESQDIIDLITVGGEKGQCDGFYRDSAGNPKAVPRVHKRIDYLSGIAGKGKPGRFARLLSYGQGIADAYVSGGMAAVDRFAELHNVGSTPVTGRAYSWMTNKDIYSPGGNFVKIPDSSSGALGGNRFFTLKKLK